MTIVVLLSCVPATDDSSASCGHAIDSLQLSRGKLASAIESYAQHVATPFAEMLSIVASNSSLMYMEEFDWDPNRVSSVLGWGPSLRGKEKNEADSEEFLCGSGSIRGREFRIAVVDRKNSTWGIKWDTTIVAALGSPRVAPTNVMIKGADTPIFVISGLSGARAGGFIFVKWDGVRGKVLGVLSGLWYEIVDSDNDGTTEVILHPVRDYVGPTRFRFDEITQSLTPVNLEAK